LINALITGVGGTASQSIIKCLKLANSDKNQYRIFVTDVDPLLVGVYRGARGYLVSRQWGKYVKEIVRICKRERIDVLIPGSDVELLHLSKSREELGRVTTILMASHNVIETCRDKLKTYEFLVANGFRAPRTFRDEEVDSALSELRSPILVKPREGFGSRHQYLIRDRQGADYAFDMIRRDGWTPILQEYLGGTEFSGMAHVATDGNGLGTMCLRSVKKFGMSYKTILDETYEMENCHVDSVARKLKSIGPLSVQFKKIGKSFYTFEMNARFTGAQIVRAVAGFNGPDVLTKNFLFGYKEHLLKPRKIVALWFADYMYVTPNDYATLVRNKVTTLKGKYPNCL
jgi:carbamoyl-phosphate synthase large subunit